jgi:maleate isomerase
MGLEKVPRTTMNAEVYAATALWRELPTRPAPDQVSRVGVITISPDDISQRDLADFLSDTNVALVSTRVVASGSFPTDFCDVGAAVTEATKTLTPGMSLDAVVFGCTSCSLALGPDIIRSWIENERPGIPVTNPMVAVMEELKVQRIGSVGIITPYSSSANDLFEPMMNRDGIHMTGGVAIKRPPNASELQPACDVYEEAIDSLICEGSPEAIVIACAALRTANLLPILSKRFSIPIITSNQAVAASIKRLIG